MSTIAYIQLDSGTIEDHTSFRTVAGFKNKVAGYGWRSSEINPNSNGDIGTAIFADVYRGVYLSLRLVNALTVDAKHESTFVVGGEPFVRLTDDLIEDVVDSAECNDSQDLRNQALCLLEWLIAIN